MPTPIYTKEAVSRYKAKHDQVAPRLPKGTKDRIKALLQYKGITSISKYAAYAILKQLEEDEERMLMPDLRTYYTDEECVNYTDLPHDQWIYPE